MRRIRSAELTSLKKIPVEIYFKVLTVAQKCKIYHTRRLRNCSVSKPVKCTVLATGTNQVVDTCLAVKALQLDKRLGLVGYLTDSLGHLVISVNKTTSTHMTFHSCKLPRLASAHSVHSVGLTTGRASGLYNRSINSAFHPFGSTGLLAGVKAGRVHLCRAAGNTVRSHMASDVP